MATRGKGTKLLNRTLMHTAAKLYYIDGISQLQVADRMQVSTATVSRLLAGARDEGIVRFEVPDLDETDDLGSGLLEALGIKSVRVLESDRPAALATQVGALLLGAGLGKDAVLAIGWGRMVQSVIQAGLPRLGEVSVVPSMGGMHQIESHFQINEFVRTAAEQVQGEACFLFAPSIASPDLRSELLRDKATAKVVDLWNRVDAAVLGIGDYHHAQSMRDVEMSAESINRVAGDVLRHYFDEDGAPVTWAGYENLMAISRDQLRAIDLCIGVAVGRDKVGSIIGAARAGLVNALVTDRKTAQLILTRLGR